MTKYVRYQEGPAFHSQAPKFLTLSVTPWMKALMEKPVQRDFLLIGTLIWGSVSWNKYWNLIIWLLWCLIDLVWKTLEWKECWKIVSSLLNGVYCRCDDKHAGRSDIGRFYSSELSSVVIVLTILNERYFYFYRDPGNKTNSL